MINILQFAYGSDKGSARNGEVFASALGYQGMNPSYSASSVDGEELTAVDGKYYLAYTPVKEGTVRVQTASGTFVNADVIDVNTGEIDPTGINDGDKAFYLYDNETVPVNAPMIKMDIKSIPITTQARKLKAIWSFDAKLNIA